ncbi:OLC1v1005133C1 [Oldenlandia corymbosa var. corymbosa]|uniref:OLC1v1005133C1 n=1 Tax=Oldenlandia corymbosa var. corymbosa TaxID=529605 RepID=A0AAV1DDY8_OLDCO|nr:OLC1v1005133C1 [Oldenlandia corymbosa var. corymbosa]
MWRPAPKNVAVKDDVNCQSSNKFLALQEIDNDGAIQLNENGDDVEDGFTKDMIEESATEPMLKEGDPDEGLLAVAKASTPNQVEEKEQRMIENMENFEKIIAQVTKGEEPDFISANKQRKIPSANRNPRVRR